MSAEWVLSFISSLEGPRIPKGSSLSLGLSSSLQEGDVRCKEREGPPDQKPGCCPLDSPLAYKEMRRPLGNWLGILAVVCPYANRPPGFWGLGDYLRYWGSQRESRRFFTCIW